jgi:anti-anti-sigma factor
MKDDAALHTIHYVTGSPILVHIGGEVDFSTIADVEAVIRHGIDQRTGDVHVDLAGLGFADVSVVNALVRLQHDAAKGSGRLVLRNPPEAFLRLLDHVGMSDRFELAQAPNSRAAVQSPTWSE